MPWYGSLTGKGSCRVEGGIASGSLLLVDAGEDDGPCLPVVRRRLPLLADAPAVDLRPRDAVPQHLAGLSRRGVRGALHHHRAILQAAGEEQHLAADVYPGLTPLAVRGVVGVDALAVAAARARPALVDS